MSTETIIQCTNKKPPTDTRTYIHCFIGIAIMVIFQFLPAYEPITEMGMKIAGAFIGMVYLWSTVGTLWPSVLGLVLVGLSGYAGAGFAGFKTVMMSSFGADAALLTLFAMVLFGAMDEAGCTQYIARWFLTRKIITGRPYVFMFVFFVGCYALSTLVSPITSLILLWPVSLRLMATVGVERCDKIWPYFYMGMFFVSAIGQPFFPFMGAQLGVLSAFEAMTGGTMPVNILSYMALNFIMSMILLAVYLLILKFVLRPDTSKLNAIDADEIAKDHVLPKMNWVQLTYMFMLPAYIIMLILPNFVQSDFFVVKLLADLGPLGVTMCWIIAFSIIRFKGKEILDFKEVSYKQFNWGIYFMIAAALYIANALSSDVTGVKEFLVEVLNPILGGKSETVFVAILFTTALIITNFANNAAMAIVLMPVVLVFSEQMGINPLPVAMGVTIMVFVAMLTPAASPHAGMMHGRRDIYSTGEIMKIGFPLCFMTLIFYIFVGYPLAKMLF